MEKDVRFIITALFLASAIFLVGAVAMFFLRQVEVEKRVVLERRVDDLDRETVRLTKELDAAAALKRDLEGRLKSASEMVKQIENQMGEDRKAKDAALAQLEKEKKESQRISNEYVKMKDEKERLSVSLDNAKGECNVLKVQLSTLQQAKEILESKLKEVFEKKQVELEKIVVKPEAAPETESVLMTEPPQQAAPARVPADTQNGEVMVVNKKFDFVVVSLGEEDGLKAGTDLCIYKNKQMIAMLKVEKVHSTMSAAKIPPEWKNADIKEGDTVVVVK